MKYLVRSVKYFLYLLAILCVILAILVATKMVSGNISEMFVNGYDSLWQIALIMLVFSLIYPRFGYTSRGILVPGATDEILPGIEDVMRLHGYVVESKEEDIVRFRKRSAAARFAKLWEDRLTFSRTATGFSVEGRTKDLVRIVSALDYRFRTPEQ